ncbi:MAG: autotransporter-associated beta strand repeat-containing protein [Opitutales bacterium]
MPTGDSAANAGVFTSADVAYFTGSADVVTLGEPIVIGGLDFGVTGYQLAGSTLTLAGGSPSVRVGYGMIATLGSQLSGTNGFTLSGGGALRLSNAANDLSGLIRVSNGLLVVGSAAALGQGTEAIVVAANNLVPQNGSLLGLTGGSLVLDGSAGGFVVARDINFEGRGPIGERGSAVVSFGNNTLSGALVAGFSELSPATFRNSRINSVNGTLTLSGSLVSQGTAASTFVALGGVNAAGVSNFTLTGALSGSGSLEKSGSGILWFDPSSVAAFTGTLRMGGSATGGQQSTVLVTRASVGGLSVFGANTATGTSSAIDLNTGTLEFRSATDLDFGAFAGGKNVYNRNNGIIYSGPDLGGSTIDGTVKLGALHNNATTDGNTGRTTLRSRNGYGFVFTTLTTEGSTSTSTLHTRVNNETGGTVVFTGNVTMPEGGTASRPRQLIVLGNGNTVIQGSIIAGSDPGKIFNKQGTGSLTILGTGTTVAGTISIEAGAIIATDFRSLNNNTAAIVLGNATTTPGNLIIGTATSPTAGGLTTSKTITLNATSASNSIYASQPGSNPVILNGAITKIAAATTGNLILGGTNTADNIVNAVIPVEPTASTGGLLKLGSGTWVLNAANTYLGATTIQNGVLKVRATAAASDAIKSNGAITFSTDGTTQTSGGTLEFRGFLNAATTEDLGALTPTAGSATVRLLGYGSGSASLTFSSLGATTGASSVNFVTAEAGGGTVTLTGQAATTATNLPGTANFQGHLYLNGADFAVIGGSGQVVAPVYADSGSFRNASGALVASVHNKLTESFTNGAVTVSSLVTNGQTLTLGGNLTVSTGAILQSGGTATLRSDSGTAREIKGAAAVNMAFRVDLPTDVLNLGEAGAPVIIPSATTGGMAKNGAGTLVIFGTNAQTGQSAINEGVVRLSGSAARLSGTGAGLAIRQGASLELDGAVSANVVFGDLIGSGSVTNVSASPVTLQSGGAGTWTGVLGEAAGAGALSVIKAGTTGSPTWSGLNTFTGSMTIAGTTGTVTVDYLAVGGQPSGIGASSADASNLVFSGTTGGLIYRGSILNGSLTLGSRSASTDRLFTLAGTAAGSGATITSNVSNNNALVWTNTGDIVFGAGAAAQTLRLAGSSTGDNTFNPRLTDNGAKVTSLTKVDAGQWNLGNVGNAYTGVTTVTNGVLALNQLAALPAASPLVLGTTTTSGVLQASGVFARDVAATPVAGVGTITWGGTTGGGGFAAHSGDLTVTLNGGAQLTWGAGGFVGTGGTQALLFGSASSFGAVNFTNPIDLNGGTRTVTVTPNSNTGSDHATLSGALSGTGSLVKTGNAVLRLTGANTYTGTTDVQQATLVVASLGSSFGGLTSSVGASGVPMTATNALVLGNATNSGATLVYVGAGETSDRMIRLRGTTGAIQIQADGSGPLVLTNVRHDTTETGNKSLYLRGSSPYVNFLSSALTNNGSGILSLVVDGGTAWVLDNPGSNYTGNTTVSAGALGFGNDAAIPGPVFIGNGTVFAHGADRTIANAVTFNNAASWGVNGGHSLTLTDARLGTSANSNTLFNGILPGEALVFQGLKADALTGNRSFSLDGPGETVINGAFATTTAFGLQIVKNGDGVLTLGTNGAASNWNQAGSAMDIDRGTLRFAADNAIPSASAANTGVTLSPELVAFDTATVDLNGTTQTITTLTATSNGTVRLDNTSANPAEFRFGANDTAVDFGSGAGTYSVENTGSGALSLVKLGNTSATFNSGVTIGAKGSIASEGGGSFTLAGAVTAATGLRVTGASTLALTGGITNPGLLASVEVGAGSVLTLLDGAGSDFANLTTLRLGDTGTGTATLNLNAGTGATDVFRLAAGGTLALGGTVTFNLTDAGLDANTTYTLLSVADGGLTAYGLSNMVQGTLPGGFDGYTWLVDDTSVRLTTGNLILGTLYWRGATDTTWNANLNNWSTDKAGTAAAVSLPGAGTDLVFAYDGASGALVTTLEQNFRLNSLRFESGATTPSSVSITTGVNVASRLEVINGVTSAAGGPPAVTIGTAFKLGGSQTWSVADASSVLTFGGALLGEADVTKSGSGRVVLAAASDPTFNAGQTADFTVSAGTLELQNLGALGTVANSNLAAVSIGSGAAFYYSNATGGTLPNPIALAGGTLSGSGANHTYSGAVSVTLASTVSLADANGGTAATARNITLSGPVTGSAGLVVDGNATVSSGNQLSGALTINNAGSTWSGPLTMNRGTVTVSAAVSPGWTGNDITFASYGRVILQGANAQTLSRTGALTLASSAVAEFQVDNTSSPLSSDFIVDQTSALLLGSGGTGANLRVFLPDAYSKLVLSGGIVLGGNSSLSVGGDAAGVVTVSGVISAESGAAYGLTINDDAGGWGTTNRVARLTGLNTFTGNVTLAEGVLEFDTVTNVSGGPSSLGRGTAISSSANGTLRFIGGSPQSTDRPITASSALTLSANGVTAADTITYAGAITPSATTDGTKLYLTGAADRVGFITGGFTMTGDAADFQVTGGRWTIGAATSRVGDDATVTGAGTELTLPDGLLQVRDDLTVTINAVLNLNGTGVLSFQTATLSSDASLRVQAGGVINLGADNAVVTADFDGLRIGVDASGTGTLNTGTYALAVTDFIVGNRNLDRTGVITGTGTIAVSNNIDLYDGDIAAGLVAAGAVTLDKLSMNTVTLSGDNSGLTGTGSNVIIEGSLILDYATSTATKLISGGALDMRGGNLTLSGNATGAVAQPVASFTLASGGNSTIALGTVNGQDLVLNLNAITRAINAQDGTVRLVLPAGVQSAANGVTTDALNTLGAGADAIIGGWLTVDDGTGVFFGRNLTNAADGNIVAAVTSAKDSVASWSGGENISDSAGFTGTVGLASVNSLRFNAAAGSDLALAPTGVLGIASGGLLVTSSSLVASGLTGGTLFSGAQASHVPELIVIHDGPQPFELSADVRANHALTKSGAGTLRLSGDNTYSGTTEVQNGTLLLAGGTAVGDGALINLSGTRNTTVRLLANETIGRLSGGSRQTDQDLGVFDVGVFTLTVDHFTSSGATYDGVFAGTGTIVRNGTSGIGNWLLRGITGSRFTGSLVLNGGLTYLETSGTMDASSVTINRGASFLISNNGDTRSGARLPDTMPMFLNSADGSWNGETRPSGLAIRIDRNATTNETIGVLTLASGASYFRGDASGTTGIAGIIASNVVRSNGATFALRGRNLGSSSGNRNFLRVVSGSAEETAFVASLVGGAGAAGAKNIPIVPWAIGETQDANLVDANMGNSLVTYVATSGSGYGLRPLSLTAEYATFTNKSANTDNVRESLSADLTGLAGQTINSLVVNNANTTAGVVSVTGTGASQALAVTSGAMLFTAVGAVTGAPAMGVTLGGFDDGITVGGSGEYVIFVQNPTSASAGGVVTATIASPLASAADITKSGRGTLVLSGTNTAGGGARRTTVNEGVLEVADLDNIGGVAGALVFAGGTLRLGSGFTDDVSLRTITFLTGGGTLDTNGVDLALAGPLGSGTGAFTKAGLGNLTLNAAATFTGGATISAGTLTVGADDALGVGGPLTVSGATLDLGVRSLTVSTLTTSGGSVAITGTGTLTAAQGFSFNQTTDLAVAAVLAGSMGLKKSQSSVLTLTGLNTYAGVTEVTAGTLAFDSLANVGGGASALGAPTSTENGIIRMGLTTNGAGLRYVGAGHSSDRIIGLQGTTGTISLFANGTGALALPSGARFEMAGNKTLTLRGTSDAALVNSIGALSEVGGVMTLNKIDGNTWLLSAVNSYTGSTLVDNGVLKLGVAGALPVATAVRLGTGATAGTLDLNGYDQTIGSLVVQSTSDAVTNSIVIPSGKTLTINGAVNLGINGDNVNTNINATGGGSLVVNSGGSSFNVGAASGSTNDSRVDADFSGLANFTANLGSGTFRVGDANTGTELNPSTFRLATNNTVTAASFRVGDGAGGSSTHVLTLGSGTNQINADTFNVGSAGTGLRSSGSVLFDAADTTGTLRVRDSAGTGRATLNVINTSGSTAGDMVSTLDLSGHEADLLLGTLTMAARSQNTGNATATLSFDHGTLDVTSVVLASRTGAGSGSANATLNLGDAAASGTPAVTIGSLTMAVHTSTGTPVETVTATLNVTGGSATIGTGSGTAVNMANAAAGRTATSSINVTGGTLEVRGDVVRTGGAGTESATLALNGGVLDLNGFAVGDATKGITFDAQAGTLRDVGTLNGAGGLTKSGAGTLTLEGAAAYAGTTTVTGGTLVLAGTSLASTVATISGGTNSTLRFTSVAAMGSLATLSAVTGATTPVFQFALDGGGTFDLPVSFIGNSTITSTIHVANNGSGTDGVVRLTGNGGTGYGNATLNVTGADGYSLYVANLVNSAGALGTMTFNPTTAALELGNLTVGRNTGTGTFGLGGTHVGSMVSGVISDGSGASLGGLSAVTKSGAGTWTLTGANTYTGATTVSAGTLVAAAGALGGTAAINVTGGALTAVDFGATPAIAVGAAGTAVFSGAGLTAGAVTVDNVADDALHFSATTGTVTLTSLGGAGNARFASNVSLGTLTGGTVTIAGATASVGTLSGGTINLGTTALTVDAGTFGGLLAGANGSLIKATAGVLTLTGANTYGGGTSVNEGELIIQDAASLGTGAVAVAAGATLNLNNLGVSNVISVATGGIITGGPDVTAVSTSGSTAVTTVLTGTGGLEKTDGGELTLTTPNFFTGGITANAAGAVISAAHLADDSSSLGASALTDPTKLVLGNGATLEFTGSTATTTSRSFTVNGAAALAVDASAAPLTFSSASIMALDPADATPELRLVANNIGVNRFEAQISADDLAAGRGLATLAIDGTGKWVLGGSANRFKGDVRVDIAGGATLGFESGALGSGATYASSVIEVANGSKLAWSGANTDDISSRLSVPAGATAKLDLGANTVTFAAAPTMGAGASLEKEGSGTLKISSAVSAPTLNVAVTSGTLAVNGTLGDVTLSSGAVLGGSGTVGAATAVAGSTVGPGNSPGTLSATSLAMFGGSNFEWQVQDATDHVAGYDKLSISGNLDLTGASANNKINFKISSLLGAGDGITLGNPLNFGPPNGNASVRVFQFATVGGLLLNSGENISDVFEFDLTEFTYSDGSASNAGLWSIEWDGNTSITLTAVPEPSTYGFGLGALALAAAAIRRRKRQAKA